MSWMRRLFIVGCVACLGGQALAAETPAVSYEKEIQPIFRRECLKCHDAKEHKGKLDLSDEAAYKSLVSIPSSQAEGMVRVKPGDPEASYLWLKLKHTASKGAGMPKGFLFSRSLSPEDLGRIEAWIRSGANP